MSNRADTATKHEMSDGVPQTVDVVDEITDAIEVLEIPERGRMDSEDLGRVLASFESQLIELNQTLSGPACNGVRKLRAECEITEEEVHGLNTELGVVVKGETG